jgi:hypothetical protein
MSRIIAVLWDFDKTLITGYMQDALFDHYGVDGVRFWDEVNALAGYHATEGAKLLASDFLYLNHILTYVRHGRFAGLTNELLRALGAKQKFAPGVPEIFESVAAFVAHDEVCRAARIKIEHYAISTGLRQIILGSAVARHTRHVWGCEFLEREAPPGFLDGVTEEEGESSIREIGYVVDHTTKTRALFEINKGVHENLGIDVNSRVPKAERRVPFENMIYIADGPSDIPSLSVVKQFGGKTYGVYQPGSPRDHEQAMLLRDQERVDRIGPADYRAGSETSAWLLSAIAEIAGRLLQSESRPDTQTPVPPIPRHIYDRDA